MRRFIKQTSLAFFFLLILLAISLFFIPDYFVRESALGAAPQKQKLLKETNSPRIIFLGGSNLCFGLQSKRIAETFQLPVVNLGLHAGIGLRYMIQDLKPYINNGDLIVLATEYTDYYSDQYWGNIELASMIFDVDPAGLAHLSLYHWEKLIPSIFKYGSLKIVKVPKIIRYYWGSRDMDIREFGYYNKHTFNKFGDTYYHWGLDNLSFSPYPGPSNNNLNMKAYSDIENFIAYAKNKGADVMILPPAIQNKTFINQSIIIEEIERELSKRNISFQNSPEVYCFDDSLFFNTPYHLNKTGVDKRTTLIIEDINNHFFRKKN